MRNVVAINFRSSARIYHFDPGDLEVKCGDAVVVETQRGVEFGFVRGGISQVDENEFGKNIKFVKRLATEEDKRIDRDNQEKKHDAIVRCKKIIAEHKLDMKLIDAEYTFEGNKLVFYFTSEKRVDFRVLVKDLATEFRKRIELRQIGVRDEARLLGGIGNCGRELCCKSWLQDFEPVSIKMAKVQNLSLNPNKISGCCGRLMCCLKYENDTYQDLKKGMPNNAEYVTTPEGPAKVWDMNIFNGTVRVRYIESERTNDSPEKLSNDLYEYDKEQIVRKPKTQGGSGQGNGKGGKGNKHKNRGNRGKQESNKDINKEIANAVAEDLVQVVEE
ncbi:MAG: stage 0 sporulation family protein [Clostridiales Family XIII bacterium]|jgi:cell fate regulator YaaT (PSP1 superfamily)|nr:stage 0 sporulation family protein [Clostridiales Family XIII bacterium]